MGETFFSLAEQAGFSQRHPKPANAAEAFAALRQAWALWMISDQAVANDGQINYGMALLLWLEAANERYRAVAKRRFDDAAEKARAAGYNGSMDDGGAGMEQTEAQTFISGLNMTLPENWEETWRKMQDEADPEYALYQRLKRRFEGKTDDR